ncbi:MAG: glycoside hydrolase family 127 protein [Bacteroidetes bacterium]|nr:glycoside hydrolase family 127 protein [Bacteroidota bacterium]
MRLLLLAALLALGCASDPGPSIPVSTTGYAFNKAPLVANPYATLPIGAIRPEGWMREQLERMADGMTGHLDEWYPTVGASNGWLGGDGDVWERGPYWLDGLVPLAYLLGDERLIEKARPYIEWTLASQDSTGYFGPRPEADGTENRPGQQRRNAADWWPRMVVLKVLQQYHEATGDERVLEFMTRYFRYQLRHLPETPLDNWTGWAGARGGDNHMSVIWLYNRTGDDFLLSLADTLNAQTYDWVGNFETGAEATDYWRTHVVNVAMAMKQPIQQWVTSGDERYLAAMHAGLHALMRDHGQAVGMFSGDELLHGTDPVHGIELCAIVEFMFSLENAAMNTGDVSFMDRLERVAYNALPTQVTDDQRDRQYFQQVNQIDLTNGDHGLFFDAYQDAACFGLLTGYPCCTTNLHQGWPKLVQHSWMATADGGLAALTYLPSSVTAFVRGGKEVTIRQETNYPVEDVVRFTIEVEAATSFPLHLRIPAWSPAARLTVNGEIIPVQAGTMAVIDRVWRTADRVRLELPADLEFSRWHENSVAVHRGPLLFAMSVEGEMQEKPVLTPGENTPNMRVVRRTGDWNYGLPLDPQNPAAGFELVRSGDTPLYFWTEDAVPVRLRAKGVRIPYWTEFNTAAGPMPPSPVRMDIRDSGEPQDIELIPYGATTLRVATFPEVIITGR